MAEWGFQAHLPVPEPGTREPAAGEVVALFAAGNRATLA